MSDALSKDRIAEDRVEALALLRQWTLTHGAALCPTAGSADSFGDGMRAAKKQVAAILSANSEALEAKAAELTQCDHEDIGYVAANREWPETPEPGALIEASRRFVADLEALDRPFTVTRKRLGQAKAAELTDADKAAINASAREVCAQPVCCYDADDVIDIVTGAGFTITRKAK